MNSSTIDPVLFAVVQLAINVILGIAAFAISKLYTSVMERTTKLAEEDEKLAAEIRGMRKDYVSRDSLNDKLELLLQNQADFKKFIEEFRRDNYYRDPARDLR